MSDKFSDHFRGEVHRWGAFTAGAYYENPTPQMLDAAKALVRNSTLLDFTYVKTHPTAGRVLAGMAGHIRPIPGMQW